MLVEIRLEDDSSLADYAAISIAYQVSAALEAPVVGTPRLPLRYRRVSAAYRKDYDAILGNHPRDWPTKFTIERARCIAAYAVNRRVGSAIVIVEPADVAQLGGDPPLALLWDLRVALDTRGRGVGRALLTAAETSACAAGASGIAVETQDINVAACRLYAGAGYAIADIAAGAYPDLPSETRLVWTKSFESYFLARESGFSLRPQSARLT